VTITRIVVQTTVTGPLVHDDALVVAHGDGVCWAHKTLCSCYTGRTSVSQPGPEINSICDEISHRSAACINNKIKISYFLHHLVDTYNRSDVSVWIRKRRHVVRNVRRMRSFSSHLQSPSICCCS